jgi:hypothetical protein
MNKIFIYKNNIMNLQEELNKIKSIMGTLTEAKGKDVYDNNPTRELGYPDMPTDDEGELDDPEDFKDNPDKWKTADDFEDDKTPIDINMKVEEFKKRVETIMAMKGGDNVDVTYFGRENVKVIGNNGKQYMAPADILNVTVILDEKNDEYFSFVIITNVFTKTTWDNMIRKYMVMKPVNMKYHKNGETQQVGKYKNTKDYMFYDDIAIFGRLKQKVVAVLKGEKKLVDLAPLEPFVPDYVES